MAWAFGLLLEQIRPEFVPFLEFRLKELENAVFLFTSLISGFGHGRITGLQLLMLRFKEVIVDLQALDFGL